MGEVYKAFDERLGRWVAVKCLRGDATDRARARFRREGRTLAQLGHPGIVQIFDVVEEEAGDWQKQRIGPRRQLGRRVAS